MWQHNRGNYTTPTIFQLNPSGQVIVETTKGKLFAALAMFTLLGCKMQGYSLRYGKCCPKWHPKSGLMLTLGEGGKK